MRRTDGLRVLLVGAALAALLVLATAGPAAAAPGCEGPPGSSAIDQYCETVPGAGGDGAGGGQGNGDGGGGSQGTGQGGGRGDDSSVGSSLGRGTSNALRRSGRDGDVLLGLPGAGGERAGGGDRSADGKVGGNGGASPSDPSDNPFSALSSAVDGGSSVAGPWLVWILLAVALVLGGLGWMRYRRNSASD